MISVNFNLKKIKENPVELLRLFLALVFLSAGIFRIFNPSLAQQEFSGLGLPSFLFPLMIVFEIVAGLLLLINKFARQIYFLLAFFLVMALGWALLSEGSALVKGAGELFVFNLTPTDVFMHIIFLIMIIVLIAGIKKK